MPIFFIKSSRIFALSLFAAESIFSIQIKMKPGRKCANIQEIIINLHYKGYSLS
jgi:hypothetical protein